MFVLIVYFLVDDHCSFYILFFHLRDFPLLLVFLKFNVISFFLHLCCPFFYLCSVHKNLLFLSKSCKFSTMYPYVFSNYIFAPGYVQCTYTILEGFYYIFIICTVLHSTSPLLWFFAMRTRLVLGAF